MAVAARNVENSRTSHHRIVFGMGVLFIGTLIHTVGTVTRGWIVSPAQLYSYGLFTFNYNSNGSLITVRTFMILAILLGVLALVLSLVYLKVPVLPTRRKLATLILVVGIGAGGTSLIGALIFALEFYFLMSVTDANYSFVLCIVGGVLLSAGSIIIFLGARKHIRASLLPRSRFVIPGQLSQNASLQQTADSVQGGSDEHVWHTQAYTEPPPAYDQLQMSSLPPAKEDPQQIMFDALPPSYSEAVKQYPKD
ncbi:hypothetical protein BsWGS_18385 [Bradybaena similaris]